MNTLTQAENSHNPQEYPISFSNHSHNEIGLHGEHYVAQVFSNAGYIVRHCARERYSGDLSIVEPITGEIFTIEVKTAKEDYQQRYGFCVRKAGHTDCSYSDFVALLCIDKHNQHHIYLIPASCINSQFAVISSHPARYKGKYAPFILRGKVDILETKKTANLWGMR